MLNESLWSIEVEMFEQQRSYLREAGQRALAREAQAGRKLAQMQARQKDGWIKRQLGFWVVCQAERVAALFGGSQAQAADEPC
jgi:hypothetical protein